MQKGSLPSKSLSPALLANVRRRVVPSPHRPGRQSTRRGILGVAWGRGGGEGGGEQALEAFGLRLQMELGRSQEGGGCGWEAARGGGAAQTRLPVPALAHPDPPHPGRDRSCISDLRPQAQLRAHLPRPRPQVGLLLINVFLPVIRTEQVVKNFLSLSVPFLLDERPGKEAGHTRGARPAFGICG